MAEFASSHPGSFIPAQLAIARAARDRLGLETVFAFPQRAGVRCAWLPDVERAGCSVNLLSQSPSTRGAQLLRIARESDARLVHSHFGWFDLEALYAGRRTGAAVIWHVHNGLFGYPLKRRVTDLVKARVLARGCAAVLAVSEHVANDLRRRGFPMAKVKVVRNGIPLDHFTHSVDAGEQMRRDLDLDAGTYVVLAFARPPDRKGADLVYDAILRLRREARDREVQLLLVGDVAPLGDYLRRHAATDVLPDWVTMIEGVDEVAALYSSANAFVSASREEGFGLAIGEAMSCRLPVVASDIPGTALFASAPGFFEFSAGDSDDLAAHLSDLMSGASDESGVANRAWVGSHFTLERHVAEIMCCYEQLLVGKNK